MTFQITNQSQEPIYLEDRQWDVTWLDIKDSGDSLRVRSADCTDCPCRDRDKRGCGTGICADTGGLGVSIEEIAAGETFDWTWDGLVRQYDSGRECLETVRPNASTLVAEICFGREGRSGSYQDKYTGDAEYREDDPSKRPYIEEIECEEFEFPYGTSDMVNVKISP